MERNGIQWLNDDILTDTPQIGMILTDQVDVGMSDFYVTAQRGLVVDMSTILGVAP